MCTSYPFWYYLNFWYRKTHRLSSLRSACFGTISIFGIGKQLNVVNMLVGCFGTISIFGIGKHKRIPYERFKRFGTISIFGIGKLEAIESIKAEGFGTISIFGIGKHKKKRFGLTWVLVLSQFLV